MTNKGLSNELQAQESPPNRCATNALLDPFSQLRPEPGTIRFETLSIGL